MGGGGFKNFSNLFKSRATGSERKIIEELIPYNLTLRCFRATTVVVKKQ